jgi:hypothetical protein
LYHDEDDSTESPPLAKSRGRIELAKPLGIKKKRSNDCSRNCDSNNRTIAPTSTILASTTRPISIIEALITSEDYVHPAIGPTDGDFIADK